MNEIQTSSTCEKPDWPLNAVPRTWVEALFDRMSATYGNRFTAMWSGTDAEKLMRAWGMELFKLSRGQLEAGVETLVNVVKCPTLPEFVAHCKAARLERVASTAPQLSVTVKTDPVVLEENLARIKEACRAAMSRSILRKGGGDGQAMD